MEAIKDPRDGGWTVHTPANLDALRALLDCGDAYVGNDSGVSHLAAFSGLPTLVLFGRRTRSGGGPGDAWWRF